MSVKRYNPELERDGGLGVPSLTMRSNFIGSWVEYQDYAALEARCAALAAELRAVEAIHNEAVFITDDHYEQCPAEVQKIIRSLAVMQIPAYQAFLAEVRAQGVGMCSAEIQKQTWDEREGDGMVAAIDAMEIYAALLRKGVI